MPDGKPVRVGIVGCGVITQMQHIPGFLRTKGVEVAAICDKNEALLEKIGSRLAGARRYEDFSRMLQEGSLDMVDISTPPPLHAAMALAAAESGCHILIEKPATLTVEEFDSVAEACTRNGVKLCQIQNKLFEPIVRGVVSQVGRGDLGEVVGVTIQILARRAASLAADPGYWYHTLPAGVFTEVLPHHIYLTQALLGAVEPVRVYVRDPDPGDPSSIRAIRVIFEGRRGAAVAAWTGPATTDKTIIDVQGTRKNLRVDLLNSTSVAYGTAGTGRAERALENVRQSLSLMGCSARTTLDVATGRFQSGHTTIIRSFVRSIREGTAPPISVDRAREVIRVLEAITEMANATRSA
jgi:predicted dehydrogenase